MTSRYDHDQPIDPRLEELLDLLRPAPPMDPKAVARGQARFLSEVDAMFAPKSSPAFPWIAGWFTKLYKPKDEKTMSTPKQKFVFTALAAFVAIFVLLFGGASVTAYASQSALPGDALYPVKTSLEQTRVNLARDAAAQAQLQLSFAERRLEEIAALINEGRYKDIDQATNEFEYHVQQAIGSLQVVAGGDPARAEELASQIAAALSSYANTLGGMMADVPAEVKPSFERALMASGSTGFAQADDEDELTGTVEEVGADFIKVNGQVILVTTMTEIKDVIAVGDIVKVHVFLDAEGALTAREVELALGDEATDLDDDNQNDAMDDENVNDDFDAFNFNDDFNANDDDNVNGVGYNDNDNDDENANGGNLNNNADDDDHGQNMNGNDDNSHDNGNSNDDNGHDNDNSGGGNDNHGGDNDNGDD